MELRGLADRQRPSSPSMPSLPESRAFLVQLSDQTDSATDVPTGRVEHIDSGRRARFSSREELWIFIETMLAQEASQEGEEL